MVIERSKAKFRARQQEEAAEQLAQLVVLYFAAPAVEALVKLEERYAHPVSQRESVSQGVQNNGWVSV